MRKMWFDEERLKMYYLNRFVSDLEDYFSIPNDATGFKYVGDPKRPSRIFYRSSAEHQLMFIALTSYMLAAEEVLMRKVSNYPNYELYECLNMFGYPIAPIAKAGYELESMLKHYKITDELWCIEEMNALRDAMKVVEPFMDDTLTRHLKNWNNGFFAELISEEMFDKIHRIITEGLQMLYSQRYTYQGLTGAVVTYQDIAAYYRNCYYDQFKKYFSCATDEGTYLKVLRVYDHGNERWADEMPGRDAKENLLFASIMLYLVMAEQSILDTVPNASNDFHKAFGWPMISSGPGGGPYLHPLKMLEYAGLSPKKYEAPLLLIYTKKVFYYLRQEMNTILNRRDSVIKDKEAACRFFEQCDGHAKSRIRKYLDRQEKSIQDLLIKWTTSPEDCWYKMLESEGIPIMNEI
jgi:hypothetical protein